jgi:hypothetical protein
MLFFGQALLALGCAAVMGWLYRSYSRHYLEFWMGAFVACAGARCGRSPNDGCT